MIEMTMVNRCVLGAACGLLAAFLWSCSGSKQASEGAKGGTENREVALEHFLSGSVFDEKNEYAKAILEYQDALHYSQDPAIYNSIAKDYSLIGKQELAILNGKEAVHRDPNNRTYHETLAQIYANALDLDGALEQSQEVVRVDSSYQDGWMNLSRLQQVRNPDKALATYQAILNRFGPDGDVYFQIAHIYTAMRKPDKAAEALRGLLAVDPSNDGVKKMLGDLYLQQDSVDAALRLYGELVELHPGDVEVRAAIADAYLVKQDYSRAAEQFEVVMRKDTLSADDQIRFGQVFVAFIEKDSAVAPTALKLFEQIRQNYPADWRPYWFLGAINNILKNDSAALFNYQKVEDLAKWNPDGWIGVASLYYDRERLDDAIRVLNDAKKYIPEEFRVYFLLGVAYQRKHADVDAATALEKAVQINGKNVDALGALAMVYDEMKRYEDSDTTYERALRLDPKNHLVLNNYGYSLAERGLQLERALRMAKEAVSQQPDNQSYLDTYGWVYFRMGNYQEAEKWVKKAIDLGSVSSVVNEHLGDIYFKLSDKDKAMMFWQKALQLDTTNESLRGKIQRGSL